MIYGNCMLIERMNNPKFKYWAIYGIIIFSVISLAIANYCYNIVEEIGGAYSFFDLLFGALGIIATGVFASLVWNQIRSQERSINIQNEQLQVSIKSISAQIVRDFSRETYHDSDLKDIHKNLKDLKCNPKNMVFDNNVDSLRLFLDHFEGLAIYWDDKVVTQHHVSEWFSKDFVNMAKCPYIMEYLKLSANLENPTFDCVYSLIRTIAKNKSISIASSTEFEDKFKKLFEN